MNMRYRLVCSAVVLVASGSTFVFAQAGASRPYQGVFGGSAPNPNVHHTLDVSASIEAGYDQNDTPAASSTSPLLTDGAYAAFAGGLAYAWQGKTVQFGINGDANARYYPDTAEYINVGNSLGIGIATQLGRRLSVVANQSVSYAPSYFYNLIPGFGSITPGTVVGGGEFPVGDAPVYVYDTTASLTYGVGPRGSIEGLSSYRYSDVGQSAAASQGDLRSASVGGRFRYSLSRNAALRLGYVYRRGQYATPAARSITGVHDIDAGVDYRRALSLTRRTSFDFATGSTIVSVPTVQAPEGELQYRLVGDAGLTHEFGRTWRARLGYLRGVGFAEGFIEPVFADGANLSLTGFFSRRIDFAATAAFSSGEVGLGSTSDSFRTWNATSRFRYGIGRSWAIYGEYLYYLQDLGNAALVTAEVPSVLHRQSLHFGLTVWSGLLRK
jgi:hypothetical protein